MVILPCRDKPKEHLQDTLYFPVPDSTSVQILFPNNKTFVDDNVSLPCII